MSETLIIEILLLYATIIYYYYYNTTMPGAYRMWLMFLGTLGTTGRVAAACCRFNAWSCCFHVLWGCALAVLSSPHPLFVGRLLVLSPELGSEQCTPQSPKAEALLCSWELNVNVFHLFFCSPHAAPCSFTFSLLSCALRRWKLTMPVLHQMKALLLQSATSSLVQFEIANRGKT